MARGQEITFIVRSYLHSLCSCFLRFFFLRVPIDLFDPGIGLWQVVPVQVRVDMGVMAIMRYSALQISSEL